MSGKPVNLEAALGVIRELKEQLRTVAFTFDNELDAQQNELAANQAELEKLRVEVKESNSKLTTAMADREAIDANDQVLRRQLEELTEKATADAKKLAEVTAKAKDWQILYNNSKALEAAQAEADLEPEAKDEDDAVDTAQMDFRGVYEKVVVEQQAEIEELNDTIDELEARLSELPDGDAGADRPYTTLANDLKTAASPNVAEALAQDRGTAAPPEEPLDLPAECLPPQHKPLFANAINSVIKVLFNGSKVTPDQMALIEWDLNNWTVDNCNRFLVLLKKFKPFFKILNTADGPFARLWNAFGTTQRKCANNALEWIDALAMHPANRP